MNSAQIVVAWRAILPIYDLDWRDAVDIAIGELQDEHGPVLRPAVHDDSRIELQFVCYLAEDHERIVEESLLSTLLSSGVAPGTLVVSACGKRAGGAEIHQNEIRELVINQAGSGIIDRFYDLARNPDDFKDQARRHLTSLIRRRSLSSFPSVIDDGPGSSSYATNPESFRAEDLL